MEKKKKKIKSLKQLADEYYIIPKDEEFIKENNIDIDKDILDNTYLVKRGIKNKKLTDEQMQEIKNSKETNRALAKKYNVSASTICNVRNKY